MMRIPVKTETGYTGKDFVIESLWGIEFMYKISETKNHEEILKEANKALFMEFMTSGERRRKGGR